MIEIEKLNFTYTPGGPYETAALCDINLKINSGEFVGLIGHTGSGKSTLTHIISGLIKPTSGKVMVDGIDITQKKSVVRSLKGKIGLVFQYPEHQLFEETVHKDIAFGPLNIGVLENEIDERVHEAIELVGLPEDVLKKSPFELSGGQKRRVAIAGVLAMHPEILILDEPTAGLDPKGRDGILGRIKQIHSKNKTTVILVSHSMEDIAKTCESVIVMQKAHIAMQGSLSEVYTRGDELRKMGLNVPKITLVMQELKKAGLDVRTDIFTVKDARDEILRLRGERSVK